MKKSVIIPIALFVLQGCMPEDASPTMMIADNFDTSAASLLRKGELTGVNHYAKGTVSIYSSGNDETIVLEPFESQNGPDLKVYLSRTESADQYINLGPLKSTTGKQSYQVPSAVDTENYPYVLIWCEKYSVIFAKSEPR